MRASSNDRIGIPTDAIHWHDGLLLAPVHFEQLTQRQEELVAYHVRSGCQYAWGVRRLELEPGRLEQGMVAVAQLEAILPDGLLVTHGAHHAPLQLAVGEALLAALHGPNTRCTIHLAVPARSASDGRSRLRAVDAGDADFSRVRPNARLVAEADLSPAAEVSLPLLRLRFEKQQLQVDPYLPPLLDCGLAPLAGGPSLRARALALYRRMAATERQLAALAAASGQDGRRFELREQWGCVASAMPALGGLLSLEGVTPLQLYLGLCQVLGQLAMLRDLALPAPDTPAYQHRDPGKTFGALFGLAESRLDAVERRYTELPFEQGEQCFTLQLEAGMLEGWASRRLAAPEREGEAPRVLLVGVRGLAAGAAEQWMAGALVACAARLDDVRERRVRGAARFAVDARGGLLRLAAEAEPAPEAAEALYAIDPHGLRTAGTALFAIAMEPELVQAGQRLQLELPGAPMPEEVVLLLATERAA